jgi:hypothetical protein
MRSACAAVLVSLAGCTSTDLFSFEEPGARFAAYSTYAIVPVPGTAPPDDADSPLTRYLREAVGAELEARGYVQSEKQPDLLVDFHLVTEETKDMRASSTSGFSAGARDYYREWDTYTPPDVIEYRAGTLSVELTDAVEERLVWKGAVAGRIREKHRENLEATVDRAVADIFSKYPYTAPGRSR